jgi:hypothetical protein
VGIGINRALKLCRRQLARALAMAAAIFVAAIPSTASAANAGGSATATVIRPNSLVNTASLSFGDIAVGQTGGTVSVSPSGVVTTTGGVVHQGGTVSAARFVGMTDWFPFWVTIHQPPASITLTRVGGGATMTVDTLSVSGGTGLRLVPLNSIFAFTVGGRLLVSGGQLPGTYSGTFTMTVDYY